MIALDTASSSSSWRFTPRLVNAIGVPMGTWGTRPFDNDAAADFLRDLRESSSIIESVREVFDTVLTAGPNAYLDIDDGQRCVAACELLVRSLVKTDGSTSIGSRSHLIFDKILDALKGERALVTLAMKALLRVLDRKHSELAAVSSSIEPFQELYERLLAVLEEGSKRPLIDVRALLATAAEPRARSATKPPVQPFSTTPFDTRNMQPTPSDIMCTVSQARAWILQRNGVLNVYDQLSEDDLETLAGYLIGQVQFARRFKPSEATIRMVDELFRKNPEARLMLTLNGHGAFDDLDCLHQIPHLRVIGIVGDPEFLSEDAEGILELFQHLSSATVNGVQLRR